MISTLDRLFLERAYELAARAVGNTSPNPPVGAVIVRDAQILGEGYHHRAGSPHAEAEALAEARDVRGATLYVSLEPCKHTGRTPPCTKSVLDAGIARVVIGALDPTEHGGGAAELSVRGIDVEVADDEEARDLAEVFARTLQSDRAYVGLKMAMSLDGYVTSRPGVAEWLTCEEERFFVRDLRVAYDAVMVGAGTVRVDDPQLTVRPSVQRLREFTRIVACESGSVAADRRIFAPLAGYARTIVLAPAGARKAFTDMEAVADVLFVGEQHETELDLAAALCALRERGIFSVLCEGGPTLAARLVARGLVDRLYWFVAPVVLASPAAVPVLAAGELGGGPRAVRLERLDRIGRDALLRGRFVDV